MKTADYFCSNHADRRTVHKHTNSQTELKHNSLQLIDRGNKPNCHQLVA